MANQKRLEFWLSFNNGAEKFQLPVNPPAIEIHSTHGYEDVDVNELGEYTIINFAKLKTFGFSSFFPRDYNPAYCNTANIRTDPWSYVKQIEKWKDSGRPMRVTITNTPFNFAATIREFTYREEGGNVGDVYFDIQFKEFTFVNFRTIDLSTTSVSNDGSDRPDSREKAGTYTVVSGDSLWKIAQAQLGDGSKYQSLADLNGIKKPYVIQPGQVIKLA